MKKINININTKGLNVGAVLSIVLLLLLAYEAWVGYSQLYKSLFTSPDVVATDNVIRVDLKSYQDTVNYLESLQTYTPDPEFITNNNPFR